MSLLLLLVLAGLAVALAHYVQLVQSTEKVGAKKLKDLQDQSQHRIDGLKSELQKISQAYKATQEQVSVLDTRYEPIIHKEEEIQKLDKEIESRSQRIGRLQNTEAEISQRILELNRKFQSLEEQDFVESCGFYESKYDFGSSEEYKQRLEQIRAKQKGLIKGKQAAVCDANWTLGDSRKQGKKLVESFTKIILRAFNGECDAAVAKVKYNNIQVLENRINKAYEELNKIAEIFQSYLTQEYLNLKLQELWLTHGYQEKKYQEQEEQRAIREQMKEEEKAIRELEKARQNAEREEQRYQEALEKARTEVETASGKAQQDLLEKIAKLQQQLEEAEANKQRAISQAQLTKSGHVYVISNIGSFGDDVYKIGMTRRLDPMDRVKELGDASVPFPFDVHAMIYCQNAPEMEKRLHGRFHHARLNQINERKEFFHVSLQDIVAAVREIDADLDTETSIEFTMVAEAAEYRKTLAKLQTEQIPV
ncbi:DUF4041 domain-containing protein [Leptolyngbya sp. FACHB-16]|uniref:DUF4041 domain-containing protein n=1 Tax=unclassified Leptolyngbya TaxID=2650499 RepID=UPI00168586BF|nr:DUF4041 domain-containing protein [Leptolyngbya sp. FACHB-16]MBD2156014.1 DUF4041 domain-containing protein [Leptolyngbya sp. FACHB-16]